jgi:6-phosphogluconolactonase
VLTGGSTPAAAYRRLAAHDLRAGVEWDRVRVAMGDERCVPPDHPDSNWGQAAAALLDHVPVPAHHLLRPQGELGAEPAADAYQATLAALPAAPAGPRASRSSGSGWGGRPLPVAVPGRPRSGRRPPGRARPTAQAAPDRVSLTLAALAGTERLLVLPPALARPSGRPGPGR